jgi:hypothetical protein
LLMESAVARLDTIVTLAACYLDGVQLAGCC